MLAATTIWMFLSLFGAWATTLDFPSPPASPAIEMPAEDAQPNTLLWYDPDQMDKARRLA